ncbi:hypothetical protein [Methylobacterium sp. C25]|uniref:hypothetical protein n=1 Tax=Methylobacterium sp. C25 TaxID=2721622 RepID=UPI001F349585|nr:hypothetical protein [Methylobacterium sp. C25]
MLKEQKATKAMSERQDHKERRAPKETLEQWAARVRQEQSEQQARKAIQALKAAREPQD